MNIQLRLGFIAHSTANMNDIDFQIICSFILLILLLSPLLVKRTKLSVHLLDSTERPESPLGISIILLRLVSTKSLQ